MTLIEFLKGLTEFVGKHPEALDCKVMYTKDSGANGTYGIFDDPYLLKVEKGTTHPFAEYLPASKIEKDDEDHDFVIVIN